MNSIVKDLFKRFAIIVVVIPSLFLFALIVYIIVSSASICTYKTIEIKLPDIESFFYVTQVKSDAIFSEYAHYKYIIHSEKKSRKALKKCENDLVLLGESFGYYTARPDTLVVRGEVLSKPDLNSINGAIVIVRDNAHFTEHCDEFLYDSRYGTLVPKDELGKVIFITDSDFVSIQPL